MPAAEPELPRLVDARRPFDQDEVLRRIVRLADLKRSARVLCLGVGDGLGVEVLAGALALDVVAVTPDAEAAQKLGARVKAAGVKGKLDVKVGPLASAGLKDKSVELALSLDRDGMPFVEVLKQVRPLLSATGRLCITYPVKVGRFPQAQAVEAWEQRLKEPLGFPRDLMGLMTQHGYEPQWAETLGDVELDAYYAGVADTTEAFKEELAVHQGQGGRSGVTFALLLGRRKEPGEKPPVSRDRG